MNALVTGTSTLNKDTFTVKSGATGAVVNQPSRTARL